MFMQVLPEFTSDTTSASPGTCYLCHGAKQPGDIGVLSLGVSIHMEGVVEVCQAHAQEIGSHFPAAGNLKDRLSDCHRNRRLDGMTKKRLESEIQARDDELAELRFRLEGLEK